VAIHSLPARLLRSGLLAVVAMGGAGTAAAAGSGPLTLTSSAFGAGASIPKVYTCEGEDISPPLSWSGVPAGARSLALIVSDPDAPDPAAPRMTWFHWVAYDLPAKAANLPESIDRLPADGRDGRNSWKRTGYGGPCPPIGRHRYFFRLYALDTVLPDLHHPDAAALLQAMQGHILEQTALMGTYRKQR